MSAIPILLFLILLVVFLILVVLLVGPSAVWTGIGWLVGIAAALGSLALVVVGIAAFYKGLKVVLAEALRALAQVADTVVKSPAALKTSQVAFFAAVREAVRRTSTTLRSRPQILILWPLGILFFPVPMALKAMRIVKDEGTSLQKTISALVLTVIIAIAFFLWIVLSIGIVERLAAQMAD